MPPISRFYNKLVPAITNEEVVTTSAMGANSNPRIFDHIHAVNATVQPRRRGRQSKDEQLVNDNGLPATAEQITIMTHQEIQRLMRDPKLTGAQKALIKKIRRRGRNKVAARKCRERRVPAAEDRTIIYNHNASYTHQLQTNQLILSENDFDYPQPSTSKDTSSYFFNPKMRF